VCVRGQGTISWQAVETKARICKFQAPLARECSPSSEPQWSAGAGVAGKGLGMG
jgi:hypothetical protein